MNFKEFLYTTIEDVIRKTIKPEYLNDVVKESTNNIQKAALNKMQYSFKDIGINVGDTLYFYPQRDSACKEEYYKRNPIPAIVIDVNNTTNNVEIGGIITTVNKFVKDNQFHGGRATNCRQGLFTENEHRLIQNELKSMDINPLINGDRTTLLKVLKSHNSIYDIAKQKLGNTFDETAIEE